MGYLDDHKKSGFKVGDIVKITRKAQSDENGWSSVWNDSMNYLVGLEVEINLDNGNTWGFQIKTTNGSTWNVPWFILEKVEDSELKVGDEVEIIATYEELNKIGISRKNVDASFPLKRGEVKSIYTYDGIDISGENSITWEMSKHHVRKIESTTSLIRETVSSPDEPTLSPKARDCSTCIDNSSSALEGRCGDCYGDHSNYIEG